GYFKEKEIMHILKRHAHSDDADVEHLETQGAMNFLELDDIKLRDEGETINPLSIVALEVNENGLPLFPEFKREPEDPFLKKIHASNEKWVVLTDPGGKPVLVLNADDFLRDVIYSKEVKSIYTYCHRPIVVTQAGTRLGDVIFKFKVRAEHMEDDVIDNDLILYWKKEKRIITGADILGRLLRGIVNRIEAPK
ncbi:MAG: Mg2+ and Co2+ transporter CorB, partial [Candidatus Omnitrophica bacterium]|nr:Mg2+ and Co2+ transporter CorB [Candidatus Omnitrophota bacterium]